MYLECGVSLTRPHVEGGQCPTEFMVEAFIDSQGTHDRECVREAVKIAADGGESFEKKTKSQLTDIFAQYGGRGFISPQTLKQSIRQAARYEFVIKAMRCFDCHACGHTEPAFTFLGKDVGLRASQPIRGIECHAAKSPGRFGGGQSEQGKNFPIPVPACMKYVG